MSNPGPHPFAPPPSERGEAVVGHPLSLQRLQGRFGRRFVLGTYALINGLLSIAVMTGAAMVTGAPLVFPSLGPTAYLLFSDPLATGSAPRNAVLGHGVGVVAGWGSLALFGLADGTAAQPMAVTPPRVAAAAVSLAVTSAVMVWAHLPHPPAAATTLIVSLGILPEPQELAVLMLAVVLLVVIGWIINRLAGIPYPVWSPRIHTVVVPPKGL